LALVADRLAGVADSVLAAVGVFHDDVVHTVARAGVAASESTPPALGPRASELSEAVETALDWGAFHVLPAPSCRWLPGDWLCGLLRGPDGRAIGAVAVHLPRGGALPAPERRPELAALLHHAEAVLRAALERATLASEVTAERDRTRRTAHLADQVSHELLNRVTAIVSNIEVVRQELGADAGPSLERGLEAVERSAERIRVMARELAQPRGDCPGPGGPLDVDLASVVRESASLLALEAGCDDVEVELDVPHLVPVAGDERELRALVDNLLSNAVKYSHPGGRVHVALRRRDALAAAELEVADEGVGMTEADRGRIFELFFRSEDPRVRARPGTGVGLHIVDRVVAGHGGRIDVDSLHGHGTRVRVHLPLEARSGLSSTS
jgi:signal transduction histidine kinase